MKIMAAMYTIKRGGAYDRFIMMLEAFLERKCEVHCLSLTPIQIKHPLLHNHIMYFPFKKVDGVIVRLAVLFFFPLWSVWIGWGNKIDLIIAFGSLYAFLLGFSKWLLQKPVVTFIRGNYSLGLRTQNPLTISVLLNKLIEYYGLLFSDKIITNNSPARDEILKRLGKRKNIDVQVLYNDIPSMNIHEPEPVSQTRRKYGIPGDAKVLVTAGILNRGKHIETLIECLPKMEVDNIYVLIAGDSSTEPDLRYKNSLQGLSKKLKVEKKVIFTGWLEKEDLLKIYFASDLFVSPSLSEGMPNAMLEALGAGLPCLGSDIPGIREILQYDELLFDPLDVRTLVKKIERILSDPQVFNKVKAFCQEREKGFRFDWGMMVFQMVTRSSENGSEKKCE